MDHLQPDYGDVAGGVIRKLAAENAALRSACKAALALISESSKIDWDGKVIPKLEKALAKNKKG